MCARDWLRAPAHQAAPLEPPQIGPKRQASPQWFPWQQPWGLREGSGHGEAGAAVCRSCPVGSEASTPAGVAGWTAARPENSGTEKAYP